MTPVIDRINKRGRGYELDPELVEYYRVLWNGYDHWINESYSASEIVVIDMDNTDVVNNEEDKQRVIKEVELALDKIRNK